MDINQLASYSPEQLTARIKEVYAEAKPYQDTIVDKTQEILTLSQEAYRRILKKRLPDAEFTETRIVARIGCDKNVLGDAPIELQRRINQLQQQGIEIIKVEYDVALMTFALHAAVEQPGVVAEVELEGQSQ